MRNHYWLAVLLAAPSLTQPQALWAQAQPPAVLNKVCGACHPLETVASQRRTRGQWQESDHQMGAPGAKGPPGEFTAGRRYPRPEHGPAGGPDGPPPGPGAR